MLADHQTLKIVVSLFLKKFRTMVDLLLCSFVVFNGVFFSVPVLHSRDNYILKEYATYMYIYIFED